MEYFNQNVHKMWSVPPVYQHGDFHPGNLILTKDHEIGVIDFNRMKISDPYEEFYKLESFGTIESIPYCNGEIDGYFECQVPKEFWEVLAVYVAHASLYSIKWAEPFGQKEIDKMIGIYHRAVEHYKAFHKIIPSWYQEHGTSYKDTFCKNL